MKYRKKPVVVEAEQFTHAMESGTDELIAGVTRGDGGECFIRTLEGEMHVSVGDFVITGIKGERYPCKPDIFYATYEAVG